MEKRETVGADDSKEASQSKKEEKLQEAVGAEESEAEPETNPESQEPKEIEEQEEKGEEDFKTKYYYLAADLENKKKRFQKEREALLKFGGEKILGDLILVVDNLERTISAIENDSDKKVKNIFIGINMVKKQFLEALAKHGLFPVESLGKDFDPSVHEAMAQEESKEKSNKIIKVFEQGYKLNGRLLRAAKVVVSK